MGFPMRTSFVERVGNKVNEIREKCGVGLERLSQDSGISLNALKLIESGRRAIKVSELFNISRALNVSISAFLSPCDNALYSRRKEEKTENYIPLKKLSEALGVSEKILKEFSRNGEIPHIKIGNEWFFRASDINLWLEHHLGSKKKLKPVERSVPNVFGIEPLLSPKEAGEILGCSHTFVRRLAFNVPCYRIGGEGQVQNLRYRKLPGF
jgi:transcriptional regulator with XRE-family HTH domain